MKIEQRAGVITGRPWTDGDKLMLRLMCLDDTLTRREMAQRLDRSVGAVDFMRCKMGLSLREMRGLIGRRSATVRRAA